MKPWFAPRTHANPWPNRELAKLAKDMRRYVRKIEKFDGFYHLFWHYWYGKPDWSMSANKHLAALAVETLNELNPEGL